MQALAAEDHVVKRSVLSRDAAVKFFRDQGENYKAEIIKQSNGNWTLVIQHKQAKEPFRIDPFYTQNYIDLIKESESKHEADSWCQKIEADSLRNRCFF